MGIQKEHHQNLAQITHGYNLDFFNSHLSTIIKESLATSNLRQGRSGTVLPPTFVILFVILSTIRRDLSYPSLNFGFWILDFRLTPYLHVGA